MIRIVILLFHIGLCCSLFSQERITNFISEGTNNDHYLRTYDNVNYFLTVDQSNQLSVYRLIDQSNKVLLYTHNFQGLYDQRGDFEFMNNYLVFATARDIVDYDFVNDVISSAPLPDGYYFSSFTNLINSSENRIPVSIKNLAQSDFRGIIYEFGGKIYEIDNSTFHLYGDVYYDKKFDSQSQTTTIYFHNFITNKTDSVGYDMTFSQYPAQADSSIYYFNNIGELYSYDKTDRKSEPVANVKLESIGSTNCPIIDNNDLVLISSSRNSCIIQYYNRSNFDLKNTFRFDLDGDFVYASRVKITNGVLTALLDDDLFILDLNTGDHFIRPTNYYWKSKFEIIDNRYILNPFETSYQNDFSDKFELIDLENMTIDSISGTFKIDWTYTVGFAKFGSNCLAAYSYDSREYQTLFDIDISTRKGSVNQDLDPTTSGLDSEASIFKFQNDIYLIGPNLYKLNGDILDSIFPIADIQEVDYQPINVQDDKIVFVQDEPKRIYSYDGQRLVEEANLDELDTLSFFGNDVEHFVVTKEFVLVEVLRGEIYRYNKNTKEIILLDDHPTSLYSTNLFSYNGNIYFAGDDSLYSTDGYNYKLILENYKPGFSSFRPNLVVFNDQLIVYADSAFVSIGADEYVTQLSSNTKIGFESFVFDKSGDYLLMGDREEKIYYDGSNVFQFKLEYGRSFSDRSTSENVFFFNESGVDGRVITFFNGHTKEYGKLPEEVQEYSVIDYFESNGEGFLLMSSGFNPYSKLYVYNVDEKFTQVTLVEEYLDVGWIGSSSFSRYHDAGFLYTGDLLFLMNDLNQLIPLENIKGDNEAYVEEKEEVTYFLAIDPIYGRQLFSSRLLYVEDPLQDDNELIVAPNPASEFLNICNNNLFEIDHSPHYSIYSLSGQLINTGHTSGLIDIGSLDPGSYLLIMGDESATKQTIFIKQ